MKKIITLFFCFVFLAPALAQKKGLQAPLRFAKLYFRFHHVINGANIGLYDSTYTNAIGEQFNIHRLKYYVGNFRFYTAGKMYRRNNYFLIDEASSDQCVLSFMLPAAVYDSVQLMIGVDSLHNVSGAQTGALDPANGMFWTWQSGYVMQKMEGSSPQSTATAQKMEYHLGGYAGQYNASQQITLRFQGAFALALSDKYTSTTTVVADLNNFWGDGFTIANTPVCNTQGLLAVSLARRFAALFMLEQTGYLK